MADSNSPKSPWAAVFSRRSFPLCAAAYAGSLAGGLRGLAAAAAETTTRRKSIILLWLNGGPATIDLWDLKPGHANGGPFAAIDTAAPGVRISEHLPKLAQRMNDLAVIRSITSKEGDHDRAHHLARTGYAPQGAIRFPALGAVVSRETTGGSAGDLPAFVSIAPSRYASQLGGGFLGATASPLVVGLHAAGPDDLVVPDLMRSERVSEVEQRRRTALLETFDRRFAGSRSDVVVDGLRASRRAALSLMHPDAAAAFRLADEAADTRDRYGRHLFGQGCLLARRLVERGVGFVEVTLDGWDTHSNNFVAVESLSTTLDTSFAALLDDLRERGLLDSTLVVCMGEFGRTPKINAGNGRDHWPHVWAATLAGGGIRGGQAVGTTDEGGLAVVDRPVRVPDLLATLCRAVDVDFTKQNVSNVGRPIRVVDPTALVVEELL
jgi:uncharacterized protein (DUF1501 family)